MAESSASLNQPDLAGPGAEQPLVERAVLVTVALSTMLAPLNSTMIAIALPNIIDEFGASVVSASWLVTAYLITMASLQPVAGKLGDRLGRRRLILGGLVYFGIASLAAALATNLPLLIFFRVQQAIAGAVALPNGAALMRDVVPAARRAGRFGLVGGAVAFAAAAGPPLGGVLVSLAGWRAIFYVNLLLVVPALLLGWRTIPTRSAREFERTFDLAGAVLLLIILMGMAGLLTQSRNGEVSPALLLTGGLILIGVAAFFLWYEWRHPDPVLQPRFFRQRSFAAANGAVCLSNLAMYSTLLTIPILLTGAGGRSSIETGLVLAALMVSSVVLSPIGGRLADRWGRRWPTVGGLSLLTFGLLLLALTAERGMLPVMVGSLSLAGVGLGLSMAGMQTAAVESVRAEEAGVASGVYSTSRYLGSITGSSVLAGLLAPTPAGSGGFGAVFLMVAVAALLSTCLSLGLHDRPPTVDHPLSHQDDLIGAARTGKPVT